MEVVQDFEGRSPVKSATLEAVIIRADGTVEDLGVVSGMHRNPIKNWWMQVQIKKRARIAARKAA